MLLLWLLRLAFGVLGLLGATGIRHTTDALHERKEDGYKWFVPSKFTQITMELHGRS